MLLTKELKIKINNKNIDLYHSKGYECNYRDVITVRIEDVAKLCTQEVIYQCDGCEEIKETKFSVFTRSHENLYEKTYCVACANKIVSKNKYNILKEYLAHNGIKKCSKCNLEYPSDSDHFFSKCDTHDGFTKYCKECMGKKFTNHLTHKPKPGFKFCIKCEKELPISIRYFPPDEMCKDGLRNVCRCCGKDGHYMNEDYSPNERWTDEDLQLLESLYHHYTNEELVELYFPNRTKHALDTQADKNGFAWKTYETYLRSQIAKGEKISKIFKGRVMSDDTKKNCLYQGLNIIKLMIIGVRISIFPKNIA